MRFIYTSKGAMKMLGCALSIEKYGQSGCTFCEIYGEVQAE
jgi:hypothetical protein